jgi:large subunit ribosomal protein L17
VVLKKLFDSLGARYATRPGGYTRILRLGTRKGDGAEMAIVELLGSEFKPKKSEDKGKKGTAKAEDKKESAPRAKGGKKAKGEEAAAE